LLYRRARIPEPPEQQKATYHGKQHNVCPPDRQPTPRYMFQRTTTKEAGAGFLSHSCPTMGTEALTAIAPLRGVGLLHFLKKS
jgi:hypothetical protein